MKKTDNKSYKNKIYDKVNSRVVNMRNPINEQYNTPSNTKAKAKNELMPSLSERTMKCSGTKQNASKPVFASPVIVNKSIKCRELADSTKCTILKMKKYILVSHLIL